MPFFFYIIVSDRGKGLINALAEVVPDATKGFAVLYHPSSFWKAFMHRRKRNLLKSFLLYAESTRNVMIIFIRLSTSFGLTVPSMAEGMEFRRNNKLHSCSD